MKEATGELNMTVITVVAIAAISLLFTVFVWPNIQSSIALNTACSNVDVNGNYTSSVNESTADGYVNCTGFTCTAHYNGKDFTRECKSGSASGT